MLTSGTTAYPMAVRVTHRNIQGQYRLHHPVPGLDLQNGSWWCCPLLLFWHFLLHTHLRVGGTLVLCNTFAYPETVLI
jgi:acyl-CoA synthetase (AMP-forming)/AMP-acid ligase II